jgi:hypothetical protein
MADLESPHASHDDIEREPPSRRVRIRIFQVALAAATIFVTAWCYQLHIALGLTATFLAKHILVALIASALRLPMRDVK